MQTNTDIQDKWIDFVKHGGFLNFVARCIFLDLKHKWEMENNPMTPYFKK